MADGEQPADQNLVQCELTKQWAPADRNRQRALHDRLAGTRVIALG